MIAWKHRNRLKCVIGCVVRSDNTLKAASCVVASAWRTKLVGPIAKLHNFVIVNSIAHLVWMLDMDTEAQLLQDPPLRFDDLVFGIYVVLIKYQRTWSPSLQRNQNKIMFPPFEMKVKKKVPFWFFVLFSFFPFQPTKSNRLNCYNAWQFAGVCGLLWFQWKLLGSEDSPQLPSPCVTASTEISTQIITHIANSTRKYFPLSLVPNYKTDKCLTPMNNCHKSPHILQYCIHWCDILLQNNEPFFFCLWKSRLAKLKGENIRKIKLFLSSVYFPQSSIPTSKKDFWFSRLFKMLQQHTSTSHMSLYICFNNEPPHHSKLINLDYMHSDL